MFLKADGVIIEAPPACRANGYCLKGWGGCECDDGNPLSPCNACAPRMRGCRGSPAETFEWPCPYGEICADRLDCKPPAGLGGMCNADDDVPCALGLACHAPSDDLGSCVPARTAGMPCSDRCHLSECDSTLGLQCVSGVCTALNFAGSGEPCSPTTKCGTPGSKCLSDGHCSFVASDGSMCGANVSCLPGSTCRDGTCALADPLTCK